MSGREALRRELSAITDGARLAGRQMTPSELPRYRAIKARLDALEPDQLLPGPERRSMPQLGSVQGATDSTLRAEKRDRLAEARRLLEHAEGRGRDLDAVELERWRRLMDEVNAIGRELGRRIDSRIASDRARRAKRARDRVEAASEPAPHPTRSNPVRVDPWY